MTMGRHEGEPKSTIIRRAAADAILTNDAELASLLVAVAESVKQWEAGPASTVETLRWSLPVETALRIARTRLGIVSNERSGKRTDHDNAR